MNAKRILIVEDEKMTQKLLGDALKGAGYQVATASDSASAVKLVREWDPDLVTLDVQLAQESPDDSWNGLSVGSWLRRLYEGNPRPAIVVISALEPSRIIEEAAAIGAYTFLPKPFTKQRLLEVVAKALDSDAGPASQTH